MRIKEIITICLLFVSVSLLAQEKTIEVTGVVTDTNKEPLVGVNVTVKDKPGLGAITDINGRYKINLEEFSRLVFSYIGFDTQEILISSKSRSKPSTNTNTELLAPKVDIPRIQNSEVFTPGCP